MDPENLAVVQAQVAHTKYITIPLGMNTSHVYQRRLLMHLSMLSPGGGGGELDYPQGFYREVSPQGGNFDRTRYPQGGEFYMTTILDNEEVLEINL